MDNAGLGLEAWGLHLPLLDPGRRVGERKHSILARNVDAAQLWTRREFDIYQVLHLRIHGDKAVRLCVMDTQGTVIVAGTEQIPGLRVFVWVI